MFVSPQFSASINRIAVLGMGHVGLPTAVAFAEMGWSVIGADSDTGKIASLQRGVPPFYEPGLAALLNKNLLNKHLEVTSDVDRAIRAASVIFVCVGTPAGEDGNPDLRGIEALARRIASNLNSYKLIIEKSTVPAITGRRIYRTIERELAARPGLRSNGKSVENGNSQGNGHAHPPGEVHGPLARFEVASNPEFLQEGRAMENLFKPDRIVCGIASERARNILTDLYKPLQCPIIFTDINTAELTKHAANTFLAMKISFINLIADICEAVNADVKDLAQGLELDPRIGKGALSAGLGFGGYCLPKDLAALAHLAESRGVSATLFREIERINSSRVNRLVQKISDILWILPGKTVALLGLSFKPGTDDVRDSPSLRVAKELVARGARVRLYDPRAQGNARLMLPEQHESTVYFDDPYTAAENTDAVVVLTDWDEFRNLDLGRLHSAMKVPVLVDGRNLLDPEVARSHGFEYICMGRSLDRRAPQHGTLADATSISPPLIPEVTRTHPATLAEEEAA